MEENNNKNINNILKNGKENCCGCYACYNICPVKAITMVDDEKGFSYPKIEEDKCINCGLCYKVCPVENVEKEEVKELCAYAAYNKNENERKNSSSGGLFSIFARKILSNNGVVFGAAFSKENNVEHIVIDNEEDLEKLRTSKYVQSEIKETYSKVKEYLEKDVKVLFTGTPCQIEGLYKFLEKDYEKLYTIDIVCHGVPSKKVWQKYLDEVLKDNTKLKPDKLEINFRNKEEGWKKFSLNIENKENKYNYRTNLTVGSYMKAFLNDLILRDSCYNCRFKKRNRISDITLADLWGAKKITKIYDDDKGLSLVTINSLKGKEFLTLIKNEIVFEKINLDDSILYNPAYVQSAKLNSNREKFFNDLDNNTMDELINRYYIKPSLIDKIINKININMKKVFNKLNKK